MRSLVKFGKFGAALTVLAGLTLGLAGGWPAPRWSRREAAYDYWGDPVVAGYYEPGWYGGFDYYDYGPWYYRRDWHRHDWHERGEFHRGVDRGAVPWSAGHAGSDGHAGSGGHAGGHDGHR